jgi:FO synthase
MQEIIIQNFRAKPGTAWRWRRNRRSMNCCGRSPSARLIFGPGMSIQAPPNLNPGVLCALIAAGINDWGGVSPVTPDYVNPEAPWPHLTLAQRDRRAGKIWSSGWRSIRAMREQPRAGSTPNAHCAAAPCTDAEGLPRADAWAGRAGRAAADAGTGRARRA